MGLDISTIANLGSSGIMSLLFFLIVRWVLTQATRSMGQINKTMVTNTLILTELYKLNLVESATKKGLINGAQDGADAARQYKNLLESMRSAENKIKTML